MKVFKYFSVILFAMVFEARANPKISVIIPVYNTERFLKECLDSVLNQTFTDFEVICVNDGSTDHCLEILQEYAKKDKRVVVITQKNAGVAAARNTGLDVATGDYIAFSDSDDYMQPYTFEIAYKEITKDDYDLVTFGAYKAEEHDKPVFKKNTQYTVTVPKDHFAHELRTNFSFVVWNKIYKRSVIASVRFDTELFGTDDAYFNICISHLIKRYAAIDARLYCWRQYVSSSSKSRITAQKIVDGLYKITEKIHCSTQTPAFSSQEQRLFSSCMFISLLSSHVIVNYGCDEFFYTSKLINDLYSRGLIDFSHSKSFLEKIIVAPFIIVGKVQNLFGSSK